MPQGTHSFKLVLKAKITTKIPLKAQPNFSCRPGEVKQLAVTKNTRSAVLSPHTHRHKSRTFLKRATEMAVVISLLALFFCFVYLMVSVNSMVSSFSDNSFLTSAQYKRADLGMSCYISEFSE